MSIINQIAKGFFNSLVSREDELFKQRISVCRECPLLKKDAVFGEICNEKLYINPKTEETSKTKKIGYINGCGCILRSKTRVPEASCPLGKW